MIDFNKLAIAMRVRRGKMSFADASAESGILKETIINIERGKSINANTFAQACAWIGVPMDYFAEDVPDAIAA